MPTTDVEAHRIPTCNLQVKRYKFKLNVISSYTFQVTSYKLQASRYNLQLTYRKVHRIPAVLAWFNEACEAALFPLP